ncbi:NAD(P)-binding protein [Didymella exigua CBS 183.55]|uniref:NAD(P)-binding protein n=1 Tax=Didymella exigua CBS 183.55 TaxID=1150837 RepID=A0A6A5RFT0_9PLEO|nr:NAD(P)-binding protein [Didymella exigua CBS 183.55]KAF1926140.1 NAD(P)-binding protein [Didymella exigua CBS 183.55]
MVKIAVAGGTGNVATELLRAPIRTGKHDVTIFTRSGAPSTPVPGVRYQKVDYADVGELTAALQGVDVCLSFLIVHLDTDSTAQRNLIAACQAAGVKRFAPSEWGIKNGSGAPPYVNKDFIAEYLAELNKEKTVLEYCLFQPSIFLDYFANPHTLSPGLITWPFFIDFESRRAIVLDDGDQPIVVTAIADDSEILARALEDPRPWPAVGGVRGCRTSLNELVALGKKIRGGEWTIEHVRGEDVLKGELKTTWVPRVEHPVIPVEQREEWSKGFVVMFLVGILNGSWDVSDEWNQRFPDYKFASAEEYLTKAWAGKP